MTNQEPQSPSTTPTNAPKLPLKKRLTRTLIRYSLRCTVWCICALPLSIARMFGRNLGRLLYRWLPRYRKVAHKNLALIYPNLLEEERKQMAIDVFCHFGQVIPEFIKTPKMSKQQVESLVTVHGKKHLDKALAMGKGVLAMSGHFGNWEMLGPWFTMNGYKVTAVARETRDPAMSKLLEDVRSGNGAQVYYRGNSVRGILSSLHNNNLVVLLADQNAVDVFVPFMGYPTGTADGAAVIHLKTGSPIVFFWCVRKDKEHFDIIFEEPVVWQATKDKTADIEGIMTLYNERLEKQIRANPTQWLWLHDRWKASPGVFADGEKHALELAKARNRQRNQFKKAPESASQPFQEENGT